MYNFSEALRRLVARGDGRSAKALPLYQMVHNLGHFLIFCLSQNEMGHNGSKCLKKHTGSFNNIFQNFRRVIQYWLVRGG